MTGAPVSVPGVGKDGRLGNAALLAALVAVVVASTMLAYLAPAPPARSFSLIAGSLYLDDDRAPVAVDLADGAATVRLLEADALVGAATATDVDVVPLDSGTLLLHRRTGQFTMLDRTGLPVRSGAGVRLPSGSGRAAEAPGGPARASAVPAGDLAYILHSSPAGTGVFLVGRATVAAAGPGTATARPRASARLDSPVVPRADAAVAVGTDLWLLTGAAGRGTLRLAHLPNGAGRTGEQLTTADLGAVTLPASLTRVTSGDGDLAVLAGADGVSLLDGRVRRQAGGSWPDDVDDVLPVPGGAQATFLVRREGRGWGVVEVDPGERTVGPWRPVTGWAERDSPRSAVRAGGTAWVLSTSADRPGTADLWQLGADAGARPLPGSPRYPVVTRQGRPAEAVGFEDAGLVAVGDRVVVNSRAHVLALVAFADDPARPPVVVEKASATSLDARGQAAALLGPAGRRSPVPTPTPTPRTAPSTTPTTPAPAFDARRRCATQAQVPHVPTVTQARTTSRAVALRWSYPVLDPADCLPSTYRVVAEPVDRGSPAPPGPLTVQGQTGAVLPGLFPATRYRVVVEAVLGRRATASAPVVVTTGPEGPAAPTGLTVRAQGRSGWSISWSSCAGRPDCVPTSSWTVVPSFCDGLGLSTPPPVVAVTGDPTVSRFDASYPAGESLLGRALTFSVVGTGPAGDAGEQATSPCTWSWARPDVSRMVLTASSPPPSRSAGSTTSTTVSLDLGPDPVVAAGGIGAEVTFQLLLDGEVVKTRGPSPALRAEFDGVLPGRRYAARALVHPPRHREVARPVGPVPVEQARAAWPRLDLQVRTEARGPDEAVLLVRVDGVTSAGSQGQTFDLTDSVLACGNAELPLRARGFDPASPLSFPVDRSLFHGRCQVRLRLGQNAPTPDSGPLYGPDPLSDVLTSAPLTLDPPDFTGVAAEDFRARWTGVRDGRSVLSVTYAGANRVLRERPGAWKVEVSGDAGRGFGCGSADAAPPVEVSVDPECVRRAAGAAAAWRVRVRLDWFGVLQGPFVVTSVAGGGPPTWASVCAPAAADFAASWTGTATARSASVTYTPGRSQLSGCAAWRVELLAPDGRVCATSTQAPSPGQPVVLPVRCDADPRVTGWSVRLGWTDVAGEDGVAAGPPLPPLRP